MEAGPKTKSRHQGRAVKTMNYVQPLENLSFLG